jgi:hypothetical protein
MDTPVPNATRANSALWMSYIDQQWGRQLTPIGGPLAAGLLGMAVATYYAAFWSDLIGRMFAANAREVTEFVQQSGADVLPRWTATPLPPPSPEDAIPPWLRIMGDAPPQFATANAARVTAGAA